MDDIAQRYFSKEEAHDVREAEPANREQAFFRAWTRKEAYIKTVGKGLLLPLDSFRVTVRTDEQPSPVHLAGNRVAARHWQMHAFDAAPGYLAALAYRGER